ncbi:hypothetical protein JCM10908_000912 [Rhodotorula pacifica]|uniref:kinase-regulated stress-responsive transcription factor SKN7 n=1 Tax=Rhodotorula pacifica TaxID=1495444 RepID=UPI00317B45D0
MSGRTSGTSSRGGGGALDPDSPVVPPTGVATSEALSPSGSATSSRIMLDERENGGDEDRDELHDELDDGASSDTPSRSAEGDSPAIDADGGTTAATSSLQAVPAPAKSQASFVHKVWAMLEDPALHDYIAWTEDGKSFLVFNPSDFARDVLPRFFKHSNFSSFLRQCNFYNWSKVNDGLSNANSFIQPDGSQGHAWEFRNPSFQRGRPDLLAKIKRKTAKTNPAPGPFPSRRRGSITSTSLGRSARDEARVDGVVENNEAVSHEGLLDAEGAIRPGSHGDKPPEGSDSSMRGKECASNAKRPLSGVASFTGDRSGWAEGSPGPASPPLPHHSRLSIPSHLAAQPQYYSHAGPSRYSPGTRPYPLPTSNAYPPSRYSFSEDPAQQRQLQTVESQVRVLSEVLHQEQLEHAATRSTCHSVLQSLIEALSGLDGEGRFHQELQAARRALSRFDPTSMSPTSTYPFPLARQSISSAASSWHSNGGSGTAPYSARPSTATQFYYNRVPAVESYTRAARPGSDPRTAMVSLGDMRPASSGSQLDGSNMGRLSPPRFEHVPPGVKVEGKPDGAETAPARQAYVVSAYPHSGCLAPMTAGTPTTSGSTAREADRVDVQGHQRSLPPFSSLLNPVDASPRWPDPHLREQQHASEPSPKRPRH